MIEAQADIALGEAIRPAAIAHSKVHSGGLRQVLLPALVFAGAIVGSSLIGLLLPLVSRRLEGSVSLLWVAGGFLGLFAAFRILARQHLRGAGLRALGSPDTLPTRFRFDDAGIAVDSERLSYRAPWDCVLFIVAAPEHWLVQIDTTTLAMPRRAFADASAERSFVALASARLTPRAKANSVFDSQ
jgi:hypothetical protein